MATFAKSTFNASIYSASRPTYPLKLFEHVFDYHRESQNARWGRAVDLGCGTGQATPHLSSPFQEIIAIDPSVSMLEKARAYCASQVDSPVEQGKLRFLQGSAEDLREIEDRSVDLLISDSDSQAQAAHWFNWDKVWPEMHRVLRQGGTAAFWGYSEMRLPAHPSLTPFITEFYQGSDPKTTIGPHWERPGRTILERNLVDVPQPASVGVNELTEVERVFFTGSYYPELPSSKTHPILMKKQMRWRDLLDFLRTSSALHAYHEKYPEDKTREDDPRFPEDKNITSEGDIDVRGGDISIRFWKDLRQGAQRDGAKVGIDDIVEVDWPMALLLTRRT